MKIKGDLLVNKKIGIYLSSFSGGGAEREMIYLANEFSNRGYYVDLIIHRDAGPLSSLVDSKVHQIMINKTYLHDIFVLSSYMRKQKPSFIVSSMDMPNWFLVLAKLFSLTKTRISWRIVTHLSASKDNSKSKFPTLYKITYPVLSKMVNSVVCISNGCKQDFIENYFFGEKSKVSVIYNPAYIATIHDQIEESFTHQFYKKDLKVIISLGRLGIAKNFETLINAFHLAYKEDDSLRLIILGEGSLKSKLQNIINDLKLNQVISLHGFEINPYKYLAKADLFVLSSIYEGFGNVIVEALALNVPVVSTDCPSGPAEILENGKWGKLVPVGDSASMATAMIETLKKSPKQETLLRAKEFNIQSVVENYIKLMEVHK
jgi:glycosyltransferase involved in cell wall biosynthesis